MGSVHLTEWDAWPTSDWPSFQVPRVVPVGFYERKSGIISCPGVVGRNGPVRVHAMEWVAQGGPQRSVQIRILPWQSHLLPRGAA